MNPKLQEQLKKASSQLTGECEELKDDMVVKYSISEKEYIECLAKGTRVDKKIIFDGEFRYKFLKLIKIIEKVEG